MQTSSHAPTMLRPMQTEDASKVLSIYQEGIDSGNATFAEQAPDWQEWDSSHLQSCRIVAVDGSKIHGWAALSSVSSRCVYGGVAEVSVYVSNCALGRGIGTELMRALIQESESAGIWMLQAGIFPQNEGSIALHRKQGFRIVGIREKLGHMSYGPMAGQWRDVALLERRSDIAG